MATNRAFGEGHGFLCGWCYWVNPNLLMSTAVVGTYVFGWGGTAMEGLYVRGRR